MGRIVIKVPSGITKQDLKNLVAETIDLQVPTEHFGPRARIVINFEDQGPSPWETKPVKKRPAKKQPARKPPVKKPPAKKK